MATERKALTRGEQILWIFAVAMLAPVIAMIIAFIVFGQGTPSLA